ncbi:hypothetical protein Nit79A3_0251 [Nitrosomonas sp. Is79A3]|uniref:hypothetical protein n=1 Tax=Nitrosomonas sp. (strain Is79A3) TaxID=261292 RepID=UPI000215D184
MSLRNLLKQAVVSTEEKCCTVARPRECNNATNSPKHATLGTTNHATNDGNASNDAGFAATPYATTMQQTPKTNATTAQQQAVIQLQIEAIRAWLFRIGEPEEDHDIVLNKCRNDPDAMEYFLKHARGEYETIY